MKRPAPDIFEYECYRSYVDDFFGDGKGAWSVGKFVKSYDRFLKKSDYASVAGFTCSRALIYKVRHRVRHFSVPLARLLCDHGKLVPTADEKEYFLLLVKEEHAQDAADRHAIREDRLALREFHTARSLDPEAHELFTRWYLPAIVELIHCLGCNADAERIARVLRPAVQLAEIEQALARLQALGLIQQGPEGGFIGPVDALMAGGERDSAAGGKAEVSSPAAWPAAPLTGWYENVLELAKWAVQTLPSPERRFHSITCAVPPSAVPRLFAELEACVKRLLHICNSEPGPCERVYQITLHCFPVTVAFQAPSGTSEA